MYLNVRIEKDLPSIVEGAVSFETGASKAQVASEVAYEHHGPDFTTDDRGALPAFYEDLILGRPMPTVFATPRIQDIDTIMAITLFLHRDLATHPATPALVYTVDFVHRLGIAALPHLDDKLARFLSAMRAYFPEKGLSQRETSNRLQTAIGWLRQYIYEGTFAFVGKIPEVHVRGLDFGTNGFVVAEGHGPLLDGWIELYRLGHLRGLLVGPPQNDHRQVLIARKSLFLPLNLEAACRIFNQMEAAMGEPPEWQVVDDLWLESPKGGTILLIQDMTKVLIRV